MGLIPHESAIAQETFVNAQPQQSNVRESRFAIQMEHARVNIENPINISYKLKQLNVLYHIILKL